MTTGTSERAEAKTAAVRHTWAGLPSLRDVYLHGDGVHHWTDEEVEPRLKELRPLVEFWAWEIERRGYTKRHTNNFAWSMIRLVVTGNTLTVPQVRGVLNVLGGQIKVQRRRAYDKPYADVRYRRGAKASADARCIVCGDALTTDVQRLRGCGDTCWQRVIALM